MRTVIPLLIALGLACAAEAEGRWGVRVEYPLEATAFAESVLWSSGPIEVGGGLEVRGELSEPVEVTPYSMLAWYSEDWWSVIELAAPATLTKIGFRFALSFGGRW